jgi:hypothetical protein
VAPTIFAGAADISSNSLDAYTLQQHHCEDGRRVGRDQFGGCDGKVQNCLPIMK